MTDTATATTDTAQNNTPEALSTAEITPTASATAAQASLGQRAGAYLIDVAVTVGIVLVISLVVGMISSTLAALLSFAGYAYIVMRDCLPFLDGQSIGKKALGLRAVTTQGNNLSGNWSPGLIRNAVLLIPFFPLVELIILCTKQNAPEGLLRLGDQWAGTKVIVSK